MKTCSKCLVDKELKMFGKNKNTKDKLSCYCASCNREIEQIRNRTKDGELIETYSSLSEAGRAVGIDSYGISRVCSGKRKTAKKYIWRFKDEC